MIIARRKFGEGNQSAVPCHLVDGIKTFNDSVLTELGVHNFVVFIDQPLLGGDKAMADRSAYLVPKLAEEGSSQNVKCEDTMVTWAIQERQHAYIQDLNFW